MANENRSELCEREVGTSPNGTKRREYSRPCILEDVVLEQVSLGCPGYPATPS